MLLKAVEYHRVPVGGSLFTLLTYRNFTRALYVNFLEGSGMKCELRDVAEDGRFPALLLEAESFPRGQGGDHGKGCLL